MLNLPKGGRHGLSGVPSFSGQRQLITDVTGTPGPFGTVTKTCRQKYSCLKIDQELSALARS